MNFRGHPLGLLPKLAFVPSPKLILKPLDLDDGYEEENLDHGHH